MEECGPLRSAWLYFRLLAGRLFNLVGVPALVRPCDYEGSICKANVSVQIGPLFTVVSVNGLDVYFHRLKGTIDGVGFSQIEHCRDFRASRLADLGVPPVDAQPKVQTEIQSEHIE